MKSSYKDLYLEIIHNYTPVEEIPCMQNIEERRMYKLNNFPLPKPFYSEGDFLVLARTSKNKEIRTTIEGPYSTQGLHVTLETSNKALIHTLERWMRKYK